MPLPRIDTLVFPHWPRLLHVWLAAGVLTCALLPAPQWHNAYVGWLPFWGVLAPVSILLLLHRQWMAAALTAFLARGPRRRRSATRRPPARRSPTAVPRPRATRVRVAV
jgi:hypothetical protein